MFLKVLKVALQTLAIICYIVIFGFVAMIVPIIFGHTPIVIQSPSMEPSIKTGSIVYYHKIDSINDLNIGDVITFRNAENSPLVTHRAMLVDKDINAIRTMGDANPSLDNEPIHFENIVGVVGKFYLPKVGFYMTYAKNPIVIAIVAFIIVANLAVSSIVNKKEQKLEEEQEKLNAPKEDTPDK
ncbi:MAG: signal peptidase I [Clostridia bacterium]